MILVGSADKDSHSLHLGEAIKSELIDKQIEVQLVNLIEAGLPLYDRAVERSGNLDDHIVRFLDDSSKADAFVWITPIYHNSYSSTLKSALDWHHSRKFTNKVVGLASNGGKRTAQAVDQLMLVARSQHMVTIPTRVCTDASDYDESLNLTANDIINRIRIFCDELISITSKVSIGASERQTV